MRATLENIAGMNRLKLTPANEAEKAFLREAFNADLRCYSVNPQAEIYAVIFEKPAEKPSLLEQIHKVLCRLGHHEHKPKTSNQIPNPLSVTYAQFCKMNGDNCKTCILYSGKGKDDCMRVFREHVNL